jgi:hypothetical protein
MEHGYVEDPPDEDELNAASTKIAKANALGRVTNSVQNTMNTAISTPTGAYHVNSILREFSMRVVEDAQFIRNYVTNRLILESGDPDPRIRLRSLELLGKISDVGLFTERTELTINSRPTVELENSLKEKLRKLVSLNTGDIEDATPAKGEIGEILAPPIIIGRPETYTVVNYEAI